MEWIHKMNAAIDYIETNVEKKNSISDVARITCCPLSRIQKMFTFATDISVSEYIRCRRISNWANDLLMCILK